MTPAFAADREVKRHFGVVADGLRSEIRLVAEGHAGLDQKLDETRQETSEFHREFLEFRKDVQVEFRELQARSAGVELA